MRHLRLARRHHVKRFLGHDLPIPDDPNRPRPWNQLPGMLEGKTSGSDFTDWPSARKVRAVACLSCLGIRQFRMKPRNPTVHSLASRTSYQFHRNAEGSSQYRWDDCRPLLQFYHRYFINLSTWDSRFLTWADRDFIEQPVLDD